MTDRKKYNFWLKRSIMDQLKIEAEQENRSLPNLVEYILQNYLAHNPAGMCNEKPGPSDQNKGIGNGN